MLLDNGALVSNGTVRITKPLNELKIPPTVQAILAARIDRLPGDQKDLLQTLAVAGKEFRLGLIRKVVAKSEQELDRMLSELQFAEFIYEQPAADDVEYTFKHALTHDVAYDSLLMERRRLLHGRIGAALESLFDNNVDEHVVELARHYARSSNPSKAVEYCLRSCEQCTERAFDLATPEFKLNDGNRAGLKANSFSGTMLTDFEAKFPQCARGFSFARLLRDTGVSNPPRSSRQS